jgi:hypothetical protein
MATKSKTLTEDQKSEVGQIVRKQVLAGSLVIFALLGGITGLSVWGIKTRIENKVEGLVAKQFEEPKIQEIVEKVAANQTSVLMSEQINPEVIKFKEEVSKKLEELYQLVAKTRDLEGQSRKHEESIQKVLISLKTSLDESQETAKQLTLLKSDIIEMQKLVATIQYYQLKGGTTIPNPYRKQSLDALNKLVHIAIPDPAERSKFVAELQQVQEPNDKKIHESH